MNAGPSNHSTDRRTETLADIDYDVTEAEELMPELHRCAVVLASKGWYNEATLVDTAATRMRIMQDDLEDIRAELEELTSAFHRMRSERDDLQNRCDDLQDEIYYLQDRYDEAMSASVEDRDRWGGWA